MKRSVFLLILCITISSCVKDVRKEEILEKDIKSHVNVIFTNQSGEEIKKLRIIMAEKEFHLGPLKDGQSTKIAVDEAYEYCFAEIITAKDTLINKPMICGNEKKYRTGEIDFKIYIDEHSKIDESKRSVNIHSVANEAFAHY